MGHLDKGLQELLKEAEAGSAEYVDYDIAPVKSIIAIQGGGSWSIAAAEAIKVLTPHLLKAGTIEAVSGTSGGAINAALTVKALNQDKGAAGVAASLDGFWSDMRRMGSLLHIPKLENPFASADDRWPNIPQMNLAWAKTISAFNPVVQFSMTTAGLKTMIDKAIGNWAPVQNGKTAIYSNSVEENVFTGRETYKVATGKDVDGDAIVSSAGLDELGGHIRMDQIMSPFNWMTGNINRYKDGAYRLNPDLDTMLENHSVTDVVVIALHPASTAAEAARKRELYTHQIHRDITAMQLTDGPQMNFHVIQITLPGNASSRLNTDPKYLDLLQKLGREQAEAQIEGIASSLGVRSSYHPQANVVADMVEKREIAYT